MITNVKNYYLILSMKLCLKSDFKFYNKKNASSNSKVIISSDQNIEIIGYQLIL